LASFLAVIPGWAISQTLYRWVDEKGTTHYSETPPAGRRSTPLTIPSTPDGSSSPPAKPAKTTDQLEEEFQRRQKARNAEAERQKRALEAAEAKERRAKQRCAEAQARIDTLHAQRRAQRAWDEHRVIATERSNRAFEERGQELNRLGKFVDENCPPA
jgi:hypothetical protein